MTPDTSPTNGVASATLEKAAAALTPSPVQASAAKAAPNLSDAKATQDLKEYELESAATALPDGGDALIKHRFTRSCELVDIEAGEDCAILYMRLGSRPGRELTKGETVASILAAEPFAPEAGSYMILSVRNDESRIRTVSAIARVRGEHGPAVVEKSPFASPSGFASPSLGSSGSASSGSTSPSLGSPKASANPNADPNANRRVSEKKGKSPIVDPKRSAKLRPPPAMSPKTSSTKRRRVQEARDVIAPPGTSLVVITRAQAEALVDALESSVPLQEFMRPSLDVALYEKLERQSVFPGDVAVALSPVDLESLQDAAGVEHMTELPSVLSALQIALDPALAVEPIACEIACDITDDADAITPTTPIIITTTTNQGQEQPQAHEEVPQPNESDALTSIATPTLS